MKGPAVLILAAGRSVRMREANKLLLPFMGRTIVEHTVERALSAKIGPVYVVVGKDDEKVAGILDDQPIQIVRNETPTEGMASSIRAGVQAAGSSRQGYAITPGDMPGIQPSTYRVLAGMMDSNPDHIIVPVCGGRRGHPVLFGARFYESLLALSGDVGGRSIISRAAHVLTEVEVSDEGIHLDVDTYEDWQRLMC